MSRSNAESAPAISIWTLVQIIGIVVFVVGFAVAFYFVSTFTKPSEKVLAQNGQLAGLILTGLAYLVIIFSMIKHSPDREE